MKYLKKTIFIFTFAFIATLFNFATVFASTVGLYINGAECYSIDTPPQIINGTTMVPLRIVSEKLGGVVNWDNSTKTATIKNANSVIKVQLNSNVINVNGNTQSLNVTPILISGNTFVPLRVIAESFGAEVQWSPNLNIVTINDNGIPVYTDAPIVPDYGKIMNATEISNKYDTQWIYGMDGSTQITNYFKTLEKMGWVYIWSNEDNTSPNPSRNGFTMMFRSNTVIPAGYVSVFLSKTGSIEISADIRGKYYEQQSPNTTIIPTNSQTAEGFKIYKTSDGKQLIADEDLFSLTSSITGTPVINLYDSKTFKDNWVIRHYNGVTDTESILYSGRLYKYNGKKYINYDYLWGARFYLDADNVD